MKAQKAAVRSTRKKPPQAAVRSTRKKPPQASVEASALDVAAPVWLKDDGLKIWRRLAPALRQAKLLTSVDAETFGRYCRNFARWLKMQAVVDAEGETYESESQHGRLKRAHPAFLIADRVERQLLAAEDRFGLNPAERQRIFVARSQTGQSGDLFDRATEERRVGDPAAEPAAPAESSPSPIGLLN